MLTPFDIWRSGAVGLDVIAAGASTRTGVLERQRLRLASLLEAACTRSALYRERRAPRFADMAPVCKAELMQRFDAWVTDPRVALDALQRFAADPAHIGLPCPGGHLLWTSSGSSGGVPGLFVQDARALAVYDALEALRRPVLRSPVQWLASAWRGQRYAFVGAVGGHFASIVSLERLRRAVPGLADVLRAFSFLQPPAALHAELEAYRPTLLATYPSTAALLAEARRDGRLAIAPDEVLTGGETLTPGTRALVERGFGCRVGNSYGASEFLALASECREHVLHLNADWAILESVDEHGRPVPDGELGADCLLTNLANHLQPLIRYRLGDRIRVHAAPCACGSPLPAIDVEGRSDELLQLCAGRQAAGLSPLALASVLEDEAGVYDYRVEQTAEDALQLSLAAGGEAGTQQLEAASGALRRYLDAHHLGGVRVDSACGVALARNAGGKARRIVGLSGPAGAGR